ncbi:hypothetical protein F4777DRAFT_537171 [Nemania sp. FL0916]|nr:hypothetical protein F4777DRAFT_537171 [Nemania sp. FL0916]
MSFTKTYFLCPTSEFLHPPPAGPLRLGSILRSTSTPQFPLNIANVVPVANENPPVVETDWKKTISTEIGFGLGVYGQFLQLVTGALGVSPEMELEYSRRTANIFAFDTVTTLSFEPTPQYVNEAVKAPAVQAYLREPKQRFAPVVSLFLVTGMKLVKGAKIEYTTSGTTLAAGNVGLTLGPKGRWTRTNETGFNRASEFVFAFRVKRLRFGRQVKIEEHSKGAFLATSTNKQNAETESVVVEDVDGSGIENAISVPDVAEDGNVYCVPA